jgi:hypothetical protein
VTDEQKEELAEEAVLVARVSTAKFPANREINREFSVLWRKRRRLRHDTGNFASLQGSVAETRREAKRFQYVLDEFPTPLNREFLDAIREFCLGIREFESGIGFLVGTGSPHGYFDARN